MATGSTHDDVLRLRRSVDWAFRQALAPDEIVPMLRRLARSASPGSEHFSYAHSHLAELSVESDPWQAALSARQVIALQSEDHRAWAVLGLSMTLLGHYRTAATAYRRALALDPNNPWYAHNLGHLIDIGLGRPADALSLLSTSFRLQPKEAEIAASYAHALARCGKYEQAREVLRPFVHRKAPQEHRDLLRWLEAQSVQTRPARKQSTQAQPKRRRAQQGVRPSTRGRRDKVD